MVVGDRGERRGVGGEGDRGERPTLAHEAPHELRRDVLGIGRTPPVAEEEHLPARVERVSHEVDRAFEEPEVLGQEDRLGVEARLEELADRRLGG